MNILIAEDDPVTRRLLEAFLKKWGYEVQVAADGKEAWEALQRHPRPNLVVSDWMMPGMDGVELCRKVRSIQDSGYIYFIILTSKGRKEDVIGGLEAGADDYLVKPFDKEELKYRVGIGERIIDLEQRILRLASTDALTGVLNRRALMERMEIEIGRSNREKTAISIIMADIDHFKLINDAHGHQAGDAVLQRFTEELNKSCRAYDFVGRYGGEEFVVCLPGATLAQAAVAAERMRRAVEEMRGMEPDLSGAIHITASFGVASSEAAHGEGIDSLIKRADKAMYRAKEEGRNRVCVEMMSDE